MELCLQGSGNLCMCGSQKDWNISQILLFLDDLAHLLGLLCLSKQGHIRNQVFNSVTMYFVFISILTLMDYYRTGPGSGPCGEYNISVLVHLSHMINQYTSPSNTMLGVHNSYCDSPGQRSQFNSPK